MNKCSIAQAQARDREFRERTLAAFWEIVKKMFPSVEKDLLWKQDGFYVGESMG